MSDPCRFLCSLEWRYRRNALLTGGRLRSGGHAQVQTRTRRRSKRSKIGPNSRLAAAARPAQDGAGAPASPPIACCGVRYARLGPKLDRNCPRIIGDRYLYFGMHARRRSRACPRATSADRLGSEATGACYERSSRAARRTVIPSFGKRSSREKTVPSGSDLAAAQTSASAKGALERLTALGRQEVELHVIVDDALEGNPPRSDPQPVADLLGDHHLAHRAPSCGRW